MAGKKSSNDEAAAATPAYAALARADVRFTPHAYQHDPRAASFGTEAADALGVEPRRVFKTLLVDLDGSLVVGVVPVSGSLDLKAVASALGGKRAQMANPQAAQRATGYVIGGISPFGQRHHHRTVVDASAEQHPTVFVSAGRRGLEVEVTPQVLLSMTGAVVASVSRS
ncbi:MAG: Cys-tRNA(Pro) deacylase [Aeromicrobium sp.]|uniref:Cys-tRNA(Pro) deacylase n=1 Tax=Aeromicrobium sp. TaxID=1871063 RepID=UPI003C4F5B79